MINEKELINDLSLSDLEKEGSLITIDCGYGKIKYIKPDNIKLQCIMEDFKAKMEE